MQCAASAKRGSSTRVQALSTQCRHSRLKTRVVATRAQTDDDVEQSSRGAGERVAKTVCVRPRKPAPAQAESSTDEDSNRTHSNEQHSRNSQLQSTSSKSSESEQTNLFAGTELALVFGDAWIVATTFLTSSLFPTNDVTCATAAVVGCWVLAGWVRGDYKCADEEDAAWVPGWTVYTGILAGCFTWLFSTPLVLLSYSVLVSHGWIDATAVTVIAEGSKVSPALEIQVALLIVMTAWRGLYYAFRDGVL